MKSQIETLKRDIEIHKEVEKELAKRSHFCQKVIKRLKQQVKELEQEKEETLARKGAVGGVVSSQKGVRNSMGGNSPKKGNVKDVNLEDSKANEDLINFLEHKLEEIEKKLAASQSDYEALQNDYMEL